mmetsp:Transcript_45380/g.130066  ORF Transcript_45380/g.130066 Transcript_45380/m.130066 type:complete len:272 (+) Transcript_45380:959-1774(+)
MPAWLSSLKSQVGSPGTSCACSFGLMGRTRTNTRMLPFRSSTRLWRRLRSSIATLYFSSRSLDLAVIFAKPSSNLRASAENSGRAFCTSSRARTCSRFSFATAFRNGSTSRASLPLFARARSSAALPRCSASCSCASSLSRASICCSAASFSCLTRLSCASQAWLCAASRSACWRARASCTARFRPSTLSRSWAPLTRASSPAVAPRPPPAEAASLALTGPDSLSSAFRLASESSSLAWSFRTTFSVLAASFACGAMFSTSSASVLTRLSS